tara:strand:- start:498 stop:1160 length:663 start_codon:yes stop_codon:yes gene_type:complete
MSQKFTILFDLDGTIIDTAPDLINAHNYVMNKHGLKQKGVKDIKRLAGRGAWVMMQRSFAEQVVDENQKKVMVKDFLEFYAKNIDKNSKPIKGIFEFFSWAKKNNISLAVCTNKTEKLAVDLLKKLKMYNNFEYVAGHDTFEFCKPDARHLTNVIEILGGNLKKTLMVGDSEVDAQAALNAKLPFILIKNGYTEKTSDEIRHNHLIEDYINFENLIKKYL